jgi:SOS-response transcriptional repressor LexA
MNKLPIGYIYLFAFYGELLTICLEGIMKIQEVAARNIQERVRALGTKQIVIADIAGISQATVSRVLKGKKLPGVDSLEGWAKALECNPYDLLREESISPRESPVFSIVTQAEAKQMVERSAGSYVAVPLIEGTIAASVCGSVDIREDQVEDYAVITQNWCKNPKNYSCIRVCGESMNPTICEGFIVAINHGNRDARQLNRKVVAVRIDDGASIKRLRIDRENSISYFTSDGDGAYGDHPPIAVPLQELHERIIGKVSWWWGHQD